MFEKLLEKTKQTRNFNLEIFLPRKLNAINDFFREENLDAAVLGVSGGIDSSVVYHLLRAAKSLPDSPIKKILPVSCPIWLVEGMSNQVKAHQDALLSLTEEGIQETGISTFPLVNIYNSITNMIDGKVNLEEYNTPWAKGQMGSVLRTPIFYYHAALLQEQGYKSIVVGTTNKDEYSIGFFGKASDAMVDLQPIIDIHKSEVYILAKKLGVPQKIIDRIPTGDVWNAETDEMTIGAPYWFIELYDEIKNSSLKNSLDYLNKEEKELWDIYSKNIENIRAKNSHKFKVGSPARTVNIL